jgi:hypothetical protein
MVIGLQADIGSMKKELQILEFGLKKIKRNSMDEYNDDDGSLVVVLILVIVLISIGIFYF